jgi:hypothetical protein
MPRKTTIVRLLVFLLATNIGSACFGVDQPKIFDLTKVITEQLDERIQASLKAPGGKFTPFEQKRFGLCGGSPSDFLPLKFTDLPWPVRSKYRLPDDPIGALTISFQGCARLLILTIEPSGPVAPHLAAILKDDLYDGCLVLRKTGFSDAFAIRFVYQLLFEALQPTEQFDWFPGRSVDEEVNDYKQSDFAPSIVFVFEGKDSLQVELDSNTLHAVLRTKDKWGSYTFDKLSAAAIEARVQDLDAIYATLPAE